MMSNGYFTKDWLGRWFAPATGCYSGGWTHLNHTASECSQVWIMTRLQWANCPRTTEELLKPTQTRGWDSSTMAKWHWAHNACFTVCYLSETGNWRTNFWPLQEHRRLVACLSATWQKQEACCSQSRQLQGAMADQGSNGTVHTGTKVLLAHWLLYWHFGAYTYSPLFR